MAQAAPLRDRQASAPSPIAPRHWGRPRAGRRLRFGRTRGFWLGGFVLGTAGCVIGFCFPYHHPVAVTVSVLWWGFYFGWLGASVGAGLGLLAERAPASPSEGSALLGNPPSGADSATLWCEASTGIRPREDASSGKVAPAWALGPGRLFLAPFVRHVAKGPPPMPAQEEEPFLLSE
jgi:hypothetical protein